MRRSAVKSDIDDLCKTVLKRFCLPFLTLNFVNFLQLTGPLTLPQVPVKLFSKIHPMSGSYWCMSTLIMGSAPLFLTPKKLSCAYIDREDFVELRSGHHIALL